jgi:hypothetical protein
MNMKECYKLKSHTSSKLRMTCVSSNNVRHPVPKTFNILFLRLCMDTEMFPKSENSRRQNSGMNQVLYRAPTITGHHRTNANGLEYLVPEIYTLM